MSKKYSYSRTIENEIFSITDCDSLDEAINQLNKAVYQLEDSRKLKAKENEEQEIKDREKDNNPENSKPIENNVADPINDDDVNFTEVTKVTGVPLSACSDKG